MAVMGTYNELSVGERFHTPARTLDEDSVRALISAGGFTHPLFTDPEFAAASGFGGIVLPGQAVLMIMGGLLEQSGRFDESVVALTGFDSVRFVRPLFAGDTVRVEIEVLTKEETPSGARGVLVMGWRCVKGGGEPVAEATARMLFNLGPR
jgi:acyl dehydratase